MKYKFKEGSYIKADAQAAGEICEKLAAEKNLTAKSLLEASRAEDAPLHGCFEWDDSVAGELYREQQARHIINCLCIVEENKEPIRAYFNILRTESTYEHIDVILQSPNEYMELLKRAKSELQIFKKKYKQLKELALVFRAIEQIEEVSNEDV